MTQDDSIELALTRRVDNILPSKAGLAQLMQQHPLTLYQGFDPTAGRLHLGHTIGMRKLMDFANLGHQVTFLFGTGTVLVGDPSERDTGRKLITEEEIGENIKTWKKQVEPIVDFDKITIKQNGKWLKPLRLQDIIWIGSHISAIQLFKRDSFQRRLKKGDTVWYHETMYPLLQGYDSVVMDVDLEIGGTDQEFNMLIGRELQKKINHKEKFVLTTPMIMGIDGQKMSKTSNNCIWLTDSAEDFYGKTMRLPDIHIPSYWELLTDMPLKSTKELLQNPLKSKKELAFNLTRQFHGITGAQKAQHHFEATVQAGDAPQRAPVVTVPGQPLTLLELIRQSNLSDSSSQIKRTIKQGGVEYNGQKLTDPTHQLTPQEGDLLKYGKREFRKIKLPK